VSGNVVSVAQPRLLAIKVVAKAGIDKRRVVLEVPTTLPLYYKVLTKA
jgi:hypothetical protein